MTRLTHSNAVRRETAVLYRGKPLVIELHAGYMLVGRKRDRGGAFALDYAAAYELAAKIAARERDK